MPLSTLGAWAPNRWSDEWDCVGRGDVSDLPGHLLVAHLSPAKHHPNPRDQINLPSEPSRSQPPPAIQQDIHRLRVLLWSWLVWVLRVFGWFGGPELRPAPKGPSSLPSPLPTLSSSASFSVLNEHRSIGLASVFLVILIGLGQILVGLVVSGRASQVLIARLAWCVTNHPDALCCRSVTSTAGRPVSTPAMSDLDVLDGEIGVHSALHGQIDSARQAHTDSAFGSTLSTLDEPVSATIVC